MFVKKNSIKTEDDSGTEHYGGKNDKKGPKIIPVPESYMLNPMLYAVAIKAIYYGINMKGRLYPMKPKVVKAPFFNNKINTQWRDNKTTNDFIKEYRKIKKTKKN